MEYEVREYDDWMFHYMIYRYSSPVNATITLSGAKRWIERDKQKRAEEAKRKYVEGKTVYRA